MSLDRRGFVVGSAAAAAGAGALALAGCAVPEAPPSIADSANAALSRIAVGSCADQNKPQPIWGTVLRDGAGLAIFGGDNVYASQRPWTLEALERAYARQAQVPEFVQLRQAVPHLAMWDDHDYGLNDGGADFAHQGDSKTAFLRFWQVGADDLRRTRDGLYDARTYGPPGQRVQVILLDTRWFRSPLKASDQPGRPGKERYVPDADPAKTLLGDVQWRWLEAQLREPAQLRLVYSSIQVLAEGHGFERWGNLPLERQRLKKLIAQTGTPGVVFLSGDRHFGALYRDTEDTPYPLYEMTSSGITHPWRQATERGINQLDVPLTELHYGMVEIDWPARRMRLALKDAQGRARQARDIAFDELRIPIS